MRRALMVACLLVAFPRGALAQDETPERADRGWFAGDRGVSAKLAVGPGAHRIYDIGVFSVDGQVSLGAQTRVGGWYGNLGIRVGGTDGGLGFQQVAPGMSWEMPLTRALHMGLGLDVCYVAFDRASSNGSIAALGLGGYAFGTYDLWRSDATALFAGLQLGGDLFPDASPLLWGGTARIGVRHF